MSRPISVTWRLTREINTRSHSTGEPPVFWCAPIWLTGPLLTGAICGTLHLLERWAFGNPAFSIPITLKMLGHSANSESPAEMEEVRQSLLGLKPNVVVISNTNATVVPMLETGELEIAFGWAYDATLAQELSLPIEYIIPQEGTILWTDYFCIPANAANLRGAELFLNFILQPEIAAQIVNESYYPMAVDGMDQFYYPRNPAQPSYLPSKCSNAKC